MYTEKQITKWVNIFVNHGAKKENIYTMLTSSYGYIPTEQELEWVKSKLERAKKYSNPIRLSSNTTDIAVLGFISGSIAWITYHTSKPDQRMNDFPLFYLGYAALSGNVAAYQLAEKKFSRTKLKGDEFVAVTNGTLLSGSTEMFIYISQLSAFKDLMSKEYFIGPPYAWDITKYGTSQMLALAIRYDYIVPRLPVMLVSMSKESQAEFIRLLIIDIKAGVENRKFALIGLKAMTRIYPNYLNIYIHQRDLVIDHLNSLLNSGNLKDVSTVELNSFLAAGIIEAEPLLKRYQVLISLEPVQPATPPVVEPKLVQSSLDALSLNVFAQSKLKQGTATSSTSATALKFLGQK